VAADSVGNRPGLPLAARHSARGHSAGAADAAAAGRCGYGPGYGPPGRRIIGGSSRVRACSTMATRADDLIGSRSSPAGTGTCRAWAQRKLPIRPPFSLNGSIVAGYVAGGGLFPLPPPPTPHARPMMRGGPTPLTAYDPAIRTAPIAGYWIFADRVGAYRSASSPWWSRHHACFGGSRPATDDRQRKPPHRVQFLFGLGKTAVSCFKRGLAFRAHGGCKRSRSSTRGCRRRAASNRSLLARDRGDCHRHPASGPGCSAPGANSCG